MEEFNGAFELVDPKLIIVDYRYQRPKKEALQATIGKDFSWGSFGALICYKRGYQYYCVDGQQRLGAALNLNGEKPPRKVPCIVFPEASLEKEAKSFLEVQVNRKAVNALEKHQAELVAKVESALKIEKAASTVGFTIGPKGGFSDARTVHAVRALHYVYDLGGEEGVVQVLTLVRDAWPDDNDGPGVHMLKALGEIYLDLGDKYSRNKVTNVLKTTTPGAIMKRARAMQNDLGGSLRYNVRRAITKLTRLPGPGS